MHGAGSPSAETLESYAQKCDAAVGVTVPDFVCDNGTEVPMTNYHADSQSCDAPNRLVRVCDPGSKFTVLTNTDDAIVVAHCRKQGHAAGRFGDIAVIQTNRKTGATCFYQALGDLDGNVKAPLKGTGAWSWYAPSTTAGIQCAKCHDNGAIIRSPYLAQLKTGPNALPGATDIDFNSDQPYGFVGEDFASWKVFNVDVQGNRCLNCHRLGVSNLAGGAFGTALDFAIRATSEHEDHKNDNLPASPIWMPPKSVMFNPDNANAAQQIRACAIRVSENPLPSSPSCTITEYTAKLSNFLAEITDSPGLIQSTFGTRGNFEIVASQGDRLAHFFRDNDSTGFPWHESGELPQWVGATPISVVMAQSNFAEPGKPGNLEAVAWMAGLTSGNFLVSYYRDGTATWHGPSTIIADGQLIDAVSGDPAFLQSTLGTKGNFELLVPEGDRLVYYFRDNDSPDLSWHKSATLPQFAGARPLSVAMIQSRPTGPGRAGKLEVIARMTGGSTGDFLASYFRDEAGAWHGPSAIVADNQRIEGVTGKSAFVQGLLGGNGNLELIVPQGDRIVHYVRDNDGGGNPWHRSAALPQVPGARPLSVSLIQSNFVDPGHHGNLEVIAKMTGPFTGDFLASYFQTADEQWHGPFNLSK